MTAKLFFKASSIANRIKRFAVRAYFRLRGLQMHGTVHFSKLYFTWHHKVSLGEGCVLEHNVFFKFDGPYSKGTAIHIGRKVFIGNATEFNIKGRIDVGNNVLIASGCKFVDHDHGIEKGTLINLQPCPTDPIVVGDNVWIGANVVILKGVTIGEGAVVAAGAVVTKSIPANEIWGGVPAKRIQNR